MKFYTNTNRIEMYGLFQKDRENKQAANKQKGRIYE